MRRFARKYHNKLMTFVGLQFLFWSITGLYMVSMDIHYIHGETLVNDTNQTINMAQVNYDINSLLGTYPKADNIELVTLIGTPVYRFKDDEQKRIINATTGQPIDAINQTQVEVIAKHYYIKHQGEQHAIASTQLLTSKEQVPTELSSRHIPVWQVTFDHFASPTLYISQQTGAIVTKRHNFWRLFDWMWRFHIMDYDDGENVANWFLLLVASLSLIGSLTGVMLTYYFVVLPQYKRKYKQKFRSKPKPSKTQGGV